MLWSESSIGVYAHRPFNYFFLGPKKVSLETLITVFSENRKKLDKRWLFYKHMLMLSNKRKNVNKKSLELDSNCLNLYDYFGQLCMGALTHTTNLSI